MHSTKKTMSQSEKTFKLTKRTIVLVEGKYANRTELSSNYTRRYRIVSGPTQARVLHKERTIRRNRKPLTRFMQFYDRATTPSYRTFKAKTDPLIDRFVDLVRGRVHPANSNGTQIIGFGGMVPAITKRFAPYFIDRWGFTKGLKVYGWVGSPTIEEILF